MSDSDRKARLVALREEAIAAGDIDPNASTTADANAAPSNLKAQETAHRSKNEIEKDERDEREEEMHRPEEGEEPVLKFRNYAARDTTLTASSLPVEPAKPVEFEEITVDIDETFGEDPEEVLVNVAPKKANWDLRRDVAPKLAKLERQTHQALAKLVRSELGNESEAV